LKLSSTEKEWYEEWFDTPYYHILYQHRDEDEAAFFLNNLLQFLQLSENAFLCDLACGKGRHAKFLASKNYKVYGLDLSKQSIDEATKMACETLQFFKHDMRELFKENVFDAVFNLFTSIGYFEKPNDHVKVFNAVYASLKKEGFFVIDFMNAKKLIKNLIEEEMKKLEGIEFYIKRKVENGKICKEIRFFADNKEHIYHEKVSAFSLADFEKSLAKAGFTIVNTFGDYALNPFQEDFSERLILICKK
jgi:SAM-dependent methyltransferase